MEYTITLTEKEFGMLINATDLISKKYRQPCMTERTQEFSKEYGNLCTKLYNTMIHQIYEL